MSSLSEINIQNEKMFIIKRNGNKEDVKYDKIGLRLKKLTYGLSSYVNTDLIAQKTISQIKSGITTKEIDNLAAEISAAKIIDHPDYSILSARLLITRLHKETDKKFSIVVKKLYNNVHLGKNKPLVSQQFYEYVMCNSSLINSSIIHDRDLTFKYFGFKTLEHSYLLKINNKIVERPQFLYMRVALCIHPNDINKAIENYNYMSNQYFTHATPTLFNAGAPNQQLSSCFLTQIYDDSVDGMYRHTLADCAQLSKYSGGIGLSIHNVRAKNSYISGTGGYSNGIVPMLRTFNELTRHIDQGGQKRNGSIAIYIEPWHADIEEWIELKQLDGNIHDRATALFYALWIPDLFMKIVEDDGDWYLMSPDESPGLNTSYGLEFEQLYNKYINENLFRKKIKARKLWEKIIRAQIKTGTPYMLYKDSCNNKSNQKNLGTIQLSNLCAEIVLYTSPKEIAVCTLASLSLPKFVNDKIFNYDELYKITRIVINNLNNIIDVNYYPLEQAEYSNKKNRPLGLGVQGLADTFILMEIPFDSDEANEVNKLIFETIYYAALTESNELSKIYGPYDTFENSPASLGILQFDMWNVTPSNRYNWNELKESIKEYGIRNSTLLACMPTASTSQIMDNNECIEPYTSNLYSRKVLSGDFQIINSHLVRDLIKLKLWNTEIRNIIIENGGSIQNIKEIPKNIRDLYKTAYDISPKRIIDMAADRGAFVCQSQSLNFHINNPDYSLMTTIHFNAWRKGLKTGMYYLRSGAKKDPINYNTVIKQNKEVKEPEQECTSCSA
jgi:ribonucleoside-diphosphate reductase alpha chain